MRLNTIELFGAALAAAALLSAAPASFAQPANFGGGTIPPIREDARPFDPKDLSGVWRGSLYGYGLKVPPFTPEGQKRFEANKPSYGLALGTPEALARTDWHIGRRRGVPPAIGNDPVAACNPLGLMRLILYSPSPFEVLQVQNKLVQRFEWTWDHREVWSDGRPLPNVDDYLPRWNGYSVGRWDGDTFVVETVGLDERQWLDHFGYPISSAARLQERWRRVNRSNLEITMTLTDPTIYATPWESDPARFRLVEGEVSPNVWNALVEDKCVPLDNDPFYEKAVKPAGGG